jgi:Mn2+/Fe2+ NRAMP family transporter
LARPSKRTVPAVGRNSPSKIVVVTATVGTTLAPWGLSFIQSYAVDEKLTVEDLRYERVAVITGSVLTGVIGLFVIITCAATLHAHGLHVNSAADAAEALAPSSSQLRAQYKIISDGQDQRDGSGQAKASWLLTPRYRQRVRQRPLTSKFLYK